MQDDMLNIMPLSACLNRIIDNRGKTPPTTKDITPYGLIEVGAIRGNFKSPNYNVITKYVTEKTYNSWFRSGHPKKGDILFSTVGSIAEVAVMGGQLECIAQNVIALDVNTEIVIPNYLYYLLSSPSIKHSLLALDISSVQPSIKVPHLLNLQILLPPLETQEAIADILGTLDDRIDLNRRMNKTLESIAQALFKSWFVDFDPVKAKMAGRQPEGIDAETASLFPDRLVESESGLIPEGWIPSTLEDVLELAYGKALKKSNRIAGLFPVYGSGGVTGTHEKAIVDGPGIIVGRKGTVGSLYWEDRDFYPIDTTFYVKPKSEIPLLYLYQLLLTLGLQAMNTDAAVPGLNRNNAYRLDVCTPSLKVLEAFNIHASLLWEKRRQNFQQQYSLKSLRDTLLPKLISGELSVAEVEKRLEDNL